MNERPHRHDLAVHWSETMKEYQIAYGDQRACVKPAIAGYWGRRHEVPVTQEDLQKAAQALIDQHDRESVLAGQREEMFAAVKDAVRSDWYEGSEEQQHEGEYTLTWDPRWHTVTTPTTFQYATGTNLLRFTKASNGSPP